MERVKGIEPSSRAWEAYVLPLNHTRTGRQWCNQAHDALQLPLMIHLQEGSIHSAFRPPPPP